MEGYFLSYLQFVVLISMTCVFLILLWAMSTGARLFECGLEAAGRSLDLQLFLLS